MKLMRNDELVGENVSAAPQPGHPDYGMGLLQLVRRNRIDGDAEVLDFGPRDAELPAITISYPDSQDPEANIEEEVLVRVHPANPGPLPPAVTDCLAHRCSKHLHAVQLHNTNEGDPDRGGAECGECIAQAGEGARQLVEDLVGFLQAVRPKLQLALAQPLGASPEEVTAVDEFLGRARAVLAK